MKSKLLILGFSLFYKFSFAQKGELILKSNSKLLSIKEGKFYYKDVWGVSPEVNPDIFNANPFTGKQRIIFYSDIDSIVFDVKPNRKYEFIVLLNGKERAHTEISTLNINKPSLKPKLFYSKIKNANQSSTDTIPFRIGTDNGIHVTGSINNSDSLDMIYDTGAGICVVTSSLINNKVKIKLDGTTQNKGTDGISTVSTSSNNKILINNLVWENVNLLSIDFKPKSSFPFDIVLGWLIFEDKIVEINYETQKMIIHNSLPLISSEYSQVEFKLVDGIHYIKCKLVINGKETETWFDFDTGSNGILSIGQKFAKENNLNDTMTKIGTSTSMGSTGIEILSSVVLLPKLKIGNYEMYQIPLSIPDKDPLGIEVKGNIGNNILKRFNVFIDFKNELLYLKPNRLYYSKM